MPCLKDLFTHEETKLAGRIEGCVSASIAIVTVDPSNTLPSCAILQEAQFVTRDLKGKCIGGYKNGI